MEKVYAIILAFAMIGFIVFISCGSMILFSLTEYPPKIIYDFFFYGLLVTIISLGVGANLFLVEISFSKWQH